jgi:hypothetical protein
MHGLKKMIEMRGGLHSCGMNQYTKRLVLWYVHTKVSLATHILSRHHRADLNCANALASDPIFPAHECNDHAGCSETAFHDDAFAFANLAVPRAQKLGDVEDLPSLNNDLTNAFAALRHLASLYPDRIHQDIEKKSQIRHSDETYIIERKLLTLSNLAGARNIITGCCIAAIIFIDNYIRGVDFNARLIGRLVARLQLSMGLILGDISLATAPTTTVRALLWIMCVGAMAAADRPERMYFVIHSLPLFQSLSIDSWDSAEDILKNFFWPTAWDADSTLLWSNVEKAQSSLIVA